MSPRSLPEYPGSFGDHRDHRGGNGGGVETADKRLLIVDDEPRLAEVVRRAASALGYDARATFSGEEFVTVFDEFRPTVVFLDMVMPDIDGYDLVTWLRDRKYTDRILVASGHDEQYARQAEQFGSDCGLDVTFLHKPFRVDDLQKAITGVSVL